MHMKLIAACIVLLVNAFASCSYGQVQGDRISLLPGGSLADYSFDIKRPAPSSVATSVWFDFSYDSGSLFATILGRNTTLDYGSDWYFARSGDIFSLETIAANRFNPFIDVDFDAGSPVGNNFYQVQFSPTWDFINGLEEGPLDFYLAVATSFFEYPRTTFGWVKLQIMQGPFFWNGETVNYKLDIIDSQVAYDFRGIIVGTSNTVPEPTAMFLSISVLCLSVPLRLFNHARE